MASKFKHPGLAAMGYYFNDDLQLLQLENDEPFKWQGQVHYDVLVRSQNELSFAFCSLCGRVGG